MPGTTESDTSLSRTTLALIFTPGISMADWDSSGIIDRETLIYEQLSEDFEEIYLFTYGSDDASYGDELPANVKLVPKRIFKSDLLYSIFLPLIHFSVLMDVDIVKTNQLTSALPAILVSLVHDAALVVRAGFVPSQFSMQKCVHRSLTDPAFYLMLQSFVRDYIREKVAYFFADGVLTSSARGFLYLERHHWISGNHMVLPNYVDVEIFAPDRREIEHDSICFVGRLQPQKNILALVQALAPLDVSLSIIGSGYLESEIRELADGKNLEVSFCGRVPNNEIPEVLNTHELFVLPSLFEGMPKVLLEAMACGKPVVATDVMGSNEVVDHGTDGVLCETDPVSLREAVVKLLGDTDRQARLSETAREKIVDHYSLETIYKQEREFYRTQLRVD